MNSLDLIRMGFRNLHRRKMRTFLTVLGVIIGTASIVAMLSIGIGMNESFEEEIRRMGSLNIIDVNRWNYIPDGSGGGVTQETTLDDKAIAKISKIEGVEAVTPIVELNSKLVSGKYVAHAWIKGIDARTMEAFDFKIDQGRLLSEEDGLAVVFGTYIPQYFYNPKARWGYYGYGQSALVDPMTDKFYLTFDMNYGEKRSSVSGTGSGNSSQKQAKLYKLQVVGVLAQTNNEEDYSVYMDINQLKKLVREAQKFNRSSQEYSIYVPDLEQGYERVKVKVKNINDVDRVQEEIKNMGFGTYSLSDIRKSYQKQSGTIQAVLGGIGAISLLVAALGISNTMVMSIYERTREIGIMKVLGCLIRDIKRLFLFEAGMIGFLGGVIGVGISYGASLLLNYFGGNFLNRWGYYIGVYGGDNSKISVIPVWLALASIGFATVIGLVCGLYPARRAMKLSALEAIRND